MSELNETLAIKVMGFELKRWGQVGIHLTDPVSGRPRPDFRPDSDHNSFNELWGKLTDLQHLQAIEKWSENFLWMVVEFNAQCAICAWQSAPLADKCKAIVDVL